MEMDGPSKLLQIDYLETAYLEDNFVDFFSFSEDSDHTILCFTIVKMFSNSINMLDLAIFPPAEYDDLCFSTQRDLSLQITNLEGNSILVG